jgi:hypothetical protein
VAARQELLRIAREIGDVELALTRRGWVIAALLSKRRWLGLHRIVDRQADALAVHRWSWSGAPGIALDPLLPQGFLDFDRWSRTWKWGSWEPVRPRYRVVLAPEAAEALDAAGERDRGVVLGRLNSLRRSPEGGDSERIERTPHGRSQRTRAYRIVWRIDGNVVTVVRVVPLAVDAT